MSRDHFDRVTAIASRQPELNPKPHLKPAEVLHYQLQTALSERDKARADCAELRAAMLAVTDDLQERCDTLDFMSDEHAADIRIARAALARLDAESKQ